MMQLMPARGLDAQGKGMYRYANGDTYEGGFFNDKFEGKGKYCWASTGDVYEGHFHADRMGAHRPYTTSALCICSTTTPPSSASAPPPLAPTRSQLRRAAHARRCCYVRAAQTASAHTAMAHRRARARW